MKAKAVIGNSPKHRQVRKRSEDATKNEAPITGPFLFALLSTDLQLDPLLDCSAESSRPTSLSTLDSGDTTSSTERSVVGVLVRLCTAQRPLVSRPYFHQR